MNVLIFSLLSSLQAHPVDTSLGMDPHVTYRIFLEAGTTSINPHGPRWSRSPHLYSSVMQLFSRNRRTTVF